MKSIKVTLALLTITGALFVSCKKETTETKTETASASKEIAKAETTSFNIEGMTCAMGCAKVIENKLAGLDGVQKASVDFDKKIATIQYDATLQTPEKLVETVEAVADGKTYKVENVKSTADKAMLYQDKQDQEKPKKKKRSKKSADEASAATATPATMETAKSCGPKEGEKKGGCCAAKKACSADAKPGVL
ncbi:heavy-metal-associated domain-containing protein [Flavobacterium sp.]|uniref:heavy-metal-associated domain-containing protein n=1 Tax=Flavobacterium sp. TaxID=239 RepID=UPI00374CD774